MKFTAGNDLVISRLPESGIGNIKVWSMCCGTMIMLQQHDKSTDKMAAGHLPEMGECYSVV